MTLYHRIATALGWTYPVIDQLTLPEAEGLVDYWRESPPAHELIAMQIGFQRPLSTDEKIAQGAMGPEDFFEHYKKTGGKVK